MPEDGKNAQQWSAEAQFSVLVEAGLMNRQELSEYCRKKGLCPQQLEQWKAEFIAAHSAFKPARKSTAPPRSDDKKRIKKLERALVRKDKALAEAEALLVLSKKAAAIWPAQEDD